MAISGKLDRSLEEMIGDRKTVRSMRRSTRTRAATGNRAAPTAPAGGIHKNTKVPRNAQRPAATKSTGITGESKIMVSNMPKDVSENQIKEYFQQSVGGVKRAEISYGPGGVSRGVAHVTFNHNDGATKAFNLLNGLLIDGRPVKVEVVVANAELIPQPMSLTQRITQTKGQPKSAAAFKSNGAKGAAASKAGAKKPAKRGRNGRPAKKTAEELDSEMQDYFNVSADGTNGAGAPAAAAPAAPAPVEAMEEDVL